jgi:hypothetical protein
MHGGAARKQLPRGEPAPGGQTAKRNAAQAREAAPFAMLLSQSQPNPKHRTARPRKAGR